MLTFWAMFTGVLVRLALPLTLTVLVVVILRRLDARWQAEAGQPMVAAVTGPRCWEVRGCPPENLTHCAAYGRAEPCWQLFRAGDGRLREACLNCQVFALAPAVARRQRTLR